MEKLFYIPKMKTLVYIKSELTLAEAEQLAKDCSQFNHLKIEEDERFAINPDPWAPQEEKRILREIKYHISE